MPAFFRKKSAIFRDLALSWEGAVLPQGPAARPGKRQAMFFFENHAMPDMALAEMVIRVGQNYCKNNR
jgi:hypothetical protein